MMFGVPLPRVIQRIAPRIGPDANEALFQGASAALVAVFSYSTASMVPWLHEAYWAPITAVVVLYPDPEATWKAGVERFFGTVLGSLTGWACAASWNENLAVYGLFVLLSVFLCFVFRIGTASRLCAVTMTVITLVPRTEAPAVVALHRFLEVSYGAACAIGYRGVTDRVLRSLRREG
jgi:uncharacterized membrane protein YccC